MSLLLNNVCQDLQREINDQHSPYDCLSVTGNHMMSTLAPLNAKRLQAQLDEMNQRWLQLMSTSLEISGCLDSNVERWECLLHTLQTVGCWVRQQRLKLTQQQPVGGDLPSVLRQSNESKLLLRHVEAKKALVQQCVDFGKLHWQENGCPPQSIDVGAHDGFGSSEQTNMVDREAQQLIGDIHREVQQLDNTWIELRDTCLSWKTTLDIVLEKMSLFNGALECVERRLAAAEVETSKWPTVGDVFIKQLQVDIDRTTKLQQKQVSIADELVNINGLANEMQMMGVVLSHVNVRCLEDFNARWKALQLAVDTRLSHLHDAFKAFGPKSHHFLSASVNSPWERFVLESKVPYFVNHATQRSQWNHPEFDDVFAKLSTFNDIRYAAYRTAMKLRLLQKKFGLHLLDMASVSDVLDRHTFFGCNDELLDVSNMVECLMCLFEHETVERGLQSVSVDVGLCVDLVLNWILNLFDMERVGRVRSLSFKVAIILMCSGHLEDKYRFLFHLIADTHGFADQQKLGVLLTDCIQIPNNLSEGAAFGGGDLAPSVRSCFEQAKERPEIQVSNFLEWLSMEPQSVVWLPVLHRLAAAEAAKHQAKCNVCRDFPIVGFRYRCLKCFNYDVCQNCFFSGRVNKGHKRSHPMQEYCTASKSGQDVRHFSKVLQNKLKSRRYFKKHPRLGYLPLQTVLNGDSSQSLASHSPQHSISQDMHSRLELYASRLAEVEQRQNGSSSSCSDLQDEHSLISRYCASLDDRRSSRQQPSPPVVAPPRQPVGVLEHERPCVVEDAIMEQEDRTLQDECSRLQQAEDMHENGSDDVFEDLELSTSGDNDMLTEAMLLRRHEGRLDARMHILSEYNSQLSGQLTGLKKLLEQSPDVQSPSLPISPLSLASSLPPASCVSLLPASSVNTCSPSSTTKIISSVNGHYAERDNIGKLFSVTGEVGEAITSLVNAMTDCSWSSVPPSPDL